MRSFGKLSVLVLMLALGLIVQNCADSIMDPVQKSDFITVEKELQKSKVTGEVEIVWKGGNGEKSPDVEKRAFADFNAHPADLTQAAKGEFIYRVTSLDQLVHREIIAEVSEVVIVGHTAWFMGQVVFDSKGCEGGDSHGGHSDSCSDSSSGGCGDDDHSDSGCGDDDHSDSGCGDVDGHDSGCGDDHTDSGCGGDDHSEGGDDGHSGEGSDGHSGGPKGKSCRMNQYIFVKAFDGGTPGTEGDEIAWKWFGPNSTHLPEWDDDLSDWHLCEKTIIGGNLTVHTESANNIVSR